MKIKDAAITMLFNEDGLKIELHDQASSTTFASVKLTSEQVTAAFSRICHTDCSIEVFGLDKINKTMENEYHVFEIPDSLKGYNPDVNELHKLAVASVPEGWTPDKYYGSKGSLFQKDGKQYARVTIRRWIDLENVNID